MPVALSGKNISSNWHTTASNDRSGPGSRVASAGCHSTPGAASVLFRGATPPSRLLAVVPAARRAALAGRPLTHLDVVSAGRRRVTVLNGAKERSARDVLAGLGDIADAAFLDGG